MVEFAMVAIVFLSVIFGITLMSLAIFNYNTVCSAARQASRYAMAHPPNISGGDTGGVNTTQVAKDAATGLDPSKLTVVVTWPPDPNFVGQTDATVTVSYTFTLDVPFIMSLPITVSSTSQVLSAQ